MVLLVHGYRASEVNEISEDEKRALTLLCKELPLKKASALVAELYSAKKNLLYKWGLGNIS